MTKILAILFRYQKINQFKQSKINKNKLKSYKNSLMTKTHAKISKKFAKLIKIKKLSFSARATNNFTALDAI